MLLKKSKEVSWGLCQMGEGLGVDIGDFLEYWSQETIEFRVRTYGELYHVCCGFLWSFVVVNFVWSHWCSNWMHIKDILMGFMSNKWRIRSRYRRIFRVLIPRNYRVSGAHLCVSEFITASVNWTFETWREDPQ
jgi:hypothetical protein